MDLATLEDELTGTFGTARIYRAGTEDVARIADISRRTYYETFGAANSPEAMQAYLEAEFSPEPLTVALANPTNYYFLVEQDQRIAGYLKLQAQFDTSDPTIPPAILESKALLLERFYLDKPWHGTGIANAMMQFCLDFAKQLDTELLWLGVWEHNPRAFAFYQKWGFEIAGQHLFMTGNEAQTDYWMLRLLP